MSGGAAARRIAKKPPTRNERSQAFAEWRDFNDEPSLARLATVAVMGLRSIQPESLPIGYAETVAAVKPTGFQIDPATWKRLNDFFARLERADDALSASLSKPYMAARDALGAVVEFLRSLDSDAGANGRFSRALGLLHAAYLTVDIPDGCMLPGGIDISGGIKRRAPQTAIELVAFEAMRALKATGLRSGESAKKVLAILQEHDFSARIATTDRDNMERTSKQRAQAFTRKYTRYMGGAVKSMKYVPPEMRATVPHECLDSEAILAWLRDQLELAGRA
jgi:hypothetical protein